MMMTTSCLICRFIQRRVRKRKLETQERPESISSQGRHVGPDGGGTEEVNDRLPLMEGKQPEIENLFRVS